MNKNSNHSHNFLQPSEVIGSCKSVSRKVVPNVLNWTDEQELIFEDVPEIKQHVIINAVAGSGKTSTMVELGKRFDGFRNRICFLAFMKSAVKAIENRAEGQFKVSTMHSEGFRLLRMYWKGLSFLDSDREYIEKWLDDPEIEGDNRSLIESISNVVSIIKHEFVDLDDIDRGMLLNSMMRSTSLTVPSGGKWSDREVAEMAIKFVGWWLDNFGSDVTGRGCTYDDMVWIPVVSEGIEADRYDVLIVDEVQDLNPVQQELIKGLGRRIVAVGDDKQAIMGFSGACNEGMTMLYYWMNSSKYGCMQYELSYTFRCPTSHVEMASKFNSVIKPYRGDRGGFEVVDEAEAYRIVYDQIGKRDLDISIMVLCRNNKPLMEIAIKMILKGVDVNFNDYSLVKRIIRVLKRNTVDQIDRKVDFYNMKCYLNPDDGRLRNLLELVIISRSVLTCVGDDVGKAIKLLDKILQQANERNKYGYRNNCNQVRLSTIHKAKGQEADMVVWIKPELVKVGSGQEANLAYVALTRSRDKFYLVGEIGCHEGVNDFAVGEDVLLDEF